MNRNRIAPLYLFLALLAGAGVAQELTVERSFSDAVDDTGSMYFATFPYSGAFEDVANSGNLFPASPCDIATSGTDGVVNADDVLCSIWGGGVPAEQKGGIQLWRFVSEECRWMVRTATKSPFGVHFAQDLLDVPPDVGYMVMVGTPILGQPVENHVVISGPCLPAFPGRVIFPAACTPRQELLHLPYNALYDTADEILCGLEGVAWTDANLDGDPDTCVGGLFDGASKLTVTWYDTDFTTSPESDYTWISRTVLSGPFGVRFIGDDYDLRVGDAYLLEMVASQQTRLWNPPIGDCGQEF